MHDIRQSEAMLALRDAVIADRAAQRDLMRDYDSNAFQRSLQNFADARGLALPADLVSSWTAPDPLGLASRHLPAGRQWPPPGWLPTKLIAGTAGYALEFLCFDGLPTDAPFFYGSAARANAHPFNRLFRYRLSLADFIRTAPTIREPAGFVFHMSRCGSTLVHRMLGAGGYHSISEPAPFDGALSLCLQQAPHPDQELLLRLVAAALGNTGDGKPLLIKLDSWHVLSWPLIRAAFPKTPAIFLYRDPVEVLVSQQRQRGVQGVPQPGLAALAGIADPFSMDFDEYGAQLIGAFCRAAAEGAKASAMLPIPYRALPGALITHILPHFRLHAGAAAQAQIAIAAREDAKSPQDTHQSDVSAKQAQASDRLRHLADRFVAPHVAALEALTPV